MKSIKTVFPTDGFPVPYQPHYDLNSPPTEVYAAPSVNNTPQFAPITPDQVKKLDNNQLLATLNIARNESSSEEKENDTLHTSLVNKARQQHSDELLQSIVESSSAAISTPDKETNDSEKGSNEGIDLNKTPNQKPPRRRKHRPKVIKEGKAKRTPKPATPKNTTENPTGKRKYVRKNVQKEPATEQGDATREIADLNGGTAAKSCRRVLNFDLEKTGDEIQGKVVGQQEELQHRNKRAFSSDSQAIELCFGPYSLSGTKSAEQINQWNRFMVEYQSTGTISNLTPSMNQLNTEYGLLQERPAAAASLAPVKDLPEYLQVIGRNKDKGYTDPCQNRCRNGYTVIQQQIHAEGLDQVVFQAKTNHESSEKDISRSTRQPVPKFPSDSSAARGSKREHFRTIGHMHPSTNNPMSSLPYQSQVYECHRNDHILGEDFTGTYKKTRTESGLLTEISGMPCVTQVEDGSGKVKTKQMNDTSVSGFTTKKDHEILNSYFESNRIAKRQSEVNKFTTERYNHSLAARHYLPMQQISSKLHSHAERMGETNGLNPVHSFPSLAAIEDHNQLPPSPPKQTPELENRQVIQTSHVHLLPTEQTLGYTPSRSVSSGRKKMLKNQDASYDYQKPTPKRRGTFHIKKNF